MNSPGVVTFWTSCSAEPHIQCQMFLPIHVLSIYTGSTEVKARAVLCPLTSKGQPISMCYRSLNIGTGWC